MFAFAGQATCPGEARHLAVRSIVGVGIHAALVTLTNTQAALAFFVTYTVFAAHAATLAIAGVIYGAQVAIITGRAVGLLGAILCPGWYISALRIGRGDGVLAGGACIVVTADGAGAAVPARNHGANSKQRG
jgi:hypothetical protein